jgi:hypothetical protein
MSEWVRLKIRGYEYPGNKYKNCELLWWAASQVQLWMVERELVWPSNPKIHPKFVLRKVSWIEFVSNGRRGLDTGEEETDRSPRRCSAMNRWLNTRCARVMYDMWGTRVRAQKHCRPEQVSFADNKFSSTQLLELAIKYRRTWNIWHAMKTWKDNRHDVLVKLQTKAGE